MVYTPHFDSNMAPPFAECCSTNLMAAHFQLEEQIARRISVFRSFEVAPGVSLNDKREMVVKGRVIITKPRWALLMVFLPLSRIGPKKQLEVSVAPSEPLTMASLCAAMRRGLMQGNAEMRSSEDARSPCTVWVKAELQAYPGDKWTFNVKIPACVTFKRKWGPAGGHVRTYKKKQDAWRVTVTASRRITGCKLWQKVMSEVYRIIDGDPPNNTPDCWGRDMWHLESLFRGNQYDCPIPVYCLGMYNGCTIDVVDEKNQKWTIFIRCPDGSTITTFTHPNDSCRLLHEQIVSLISQRMPLPASEVYTSYNSKLLEYCDARVWRTGMHNGSTVNANVRLRGGVCVPYSGNLKRKKNQVIPR